MEKNKAAYFEIMIESIDAILGYSEGMDLGRSEHQRSETS